MPPPFDTVISIGGQSLVDGVWRLFGPALEGLSNPLPIALPGFSNASMRITHIVPVFPGTPPPTGALDVRAYVELSAEALLNVNVATSNFTISLGPQQLQLTNLTGTIGLPSQTGTLTNINIGGNYPAPIGHVDLGQTGTGSLNLPASTANLTNGNLTGTLNLPGNLMLPSIPFPAVVPVAVNLTPSAPLEVSAALRLTVNGINRATRFGLHINVTNVSVGNIMLSGTPLNVSTLAGNLTQTLQTAVNQIVQQIVPPNVVVTQPMLDVMKVSALLAPLPNVVRSALTDAFTTLLGETGRLVYPPAGAGASCDVTALPTAGDAQLVVAADNTYVLQL